MPFKPASILHIAIKCNVFSVQKLAKLSCCCKLLTLKQYFTIFPVFFIGWCFISPTPFSRKRKHSRHIYDYCYIMLNILGKRELFQKIEFLIFIRKKRSYTLLVLMQMLQITGIKILIFLKDILNCETLKFYPRLNCHVVLIGSK